MRCFIFFQFWFTLPKPSTTNSRARASSTFEHQNYLTFGFQPALIILDFHISTWSNGSLFQWIDPHWELEKKIIPLSHFKGRMVSDFSYLTNQSLSWGRGMTPLTWTHCQKKIGSKIDSTRLPSMSTPNRWHHFRPGLIKLHCPQASPTFQS